jgi:anti-sigma B factor antagonist
VDGLEVEHEAHQTDTATARAYRVIARGEIDVATAPILSLQFDALLAQGAVLLVLDASNVDFVDSSGLRCIIAATQQIEAAGGRFLIEGMSPAMERILDVTGVIEQYRSTD